MAGIERAIHEASLGTAVGCHELEAADRILAHGGISLILSEVLLDRSDVLSGLGTIRVKYPEIPLVVLTGHDNPTYLARASALGASDYILKSDPVDTLIGTLRAIRQQGMKAVSQRLNEIREMTRLRNNESLPNEFPLTDREAQVLRHLALGLSNKEIAASLNISVETVKEHVQNTLRKIGAADRTDAAVRAVRAGLLD